MFTRRTEFSSNVDSALRSAITNADMASFMGNTITATGSATVAFTIWEAISKNSSNADTTHVLAGGILAIAIGGLVKIGVNLGLNSSKTARLMEKVVSELEAANAKSDNNEQPGFPLHFNRTLDDDRLPKQSREFRVPQELIYIHQPDAKIFNPEQSSNSLTTEPGTSFSGRKKFSEAVDRELRQTIDLVSGANNLGNATLALGAELAAFASNDPKVLFLAFALGVAGAVCKLSVAVKTNSPRTRYLMAKVENELSQIGVKENGTSQAWGLHRNKNYEGPNGEAYCVPSRLVSAYQKFKTRTANGFAVG